MKRFLFFISCMLLTISQAWAIVIPTTAKVPAAGSIVTQPLTSVTFTYDKEIASITTTNSTITNTLLVQGKTQTEKIFATLSTTVISSDKKTVTFTLPKAITIPQVYDVTLVGYVNFVDGSTSNWDRYTFTYAEPQLDPVSSLPGDGEPHEGYLYSYSLTYDKPITNTPAADGLKIYGLDEYFDPVYERTENYTEVATSTKAEVSADKKTVTYTIAHNHYGSKFYAELPYGALKGNGWTSAPVKRWINTYVNPDVELRWGEDGTAANGSQVTQVDNIALIYKQCTGTWPLSIDAEAFGTVDGNTGLAWIQKKKDGQWVDYQIAKLRFGNGDQTACIYPCVVDDKGNITERKAIMRPGQYRLVVPTGSVFTSPFKKSFPVDQLMNQEMEVTFSIAGDESTEWLSPLTSTPAANSKVSNQLAEVTFTYPMAITRVPAASTLKVYDKDGTRLLGTATSVSVSEGTITYTLASPVKYWGTVVVKVDADVLGGQGWTNEAISRNVIIQERRNIFSAMPADTWRIMALEIDMEGEHQPLQGNLYDYNGIPFPIHDKDGKYIKMDISAHGAETNSFGFCEVPLIQQGWMIGEGEYSVDLPAGYLRCPAETTTDEEDGEEMVTRWIESEATHFVFTLGPQLPTQFSTNPKNGATVTKIDEITLTVNEAQVLYSTGNNYFWVSKNGGEPIKYLIYDADRDGNSVSDSEYGSSDMMQIDATTPNKVVFKIAEGFKTPGEDTFGYGESGAYTITVPAGMFLVDNAYNNTDMTFTINVENNVHDKRDFQGAYDITPAAGDTITTVADLQEIVLKFKGTDDITLSDVSATVKGANNRTYMTLQSCTRVDAITWKFTMQRDANVAEYQDSELKFTFAAKVNADGKKCIYDNQDNMDLDFDMDEFGTTWKYMTPEAYEANYVTFSPDNDEVVESLGQVDVIAAQSCKFTTPFVPEVRMDIYLNGVKLEGYYTKNTNMVTTTTGAMRIYNASGRTTLTAPGHYTITVPAGAFKLQDATYHDVANKEHTVSFIIGSATVITDINRDGNMDVADVTALVDIVLGKDNVEPYKYDHKAADVNGDGKFDVSDVTALVNLILNKK